LAVFSVAVFLFFPGAGYCSLLNLGAEQIIQAGGSNVFVNGYSVPSYVDWDSDGRMDLVVGEGGGGYSDGKVRVYLNTGTASDPEFSSYSYVQSAGSDLTVLGSGCLGAFPRVVHWDGDGRKDLVVGQADGTVSVYLNTGTDSNPVFDSGTNLQVGSSGSKTNITVGSRATPTIVDWNNDGTEDLLVGCLIGQVFLYENVGSDDAPDFVSTQYVQENGSNLSVPTARSSPVIMDLDGDGNKDILTGNTEGQLVFYSNVGTDGSPVFSGYELVESLGAAIDLGGYARSRPFVCDWTGDGYLDILIGGSDGQVHLYQGVPEPATVLLLGLGAMGLVRRRKVVR
jgi:hypothetical protein